MPRGMRQSLDLRRHALDRPAIRHEIKSIGDICADAFPVSPATPLTPSTTAGAGAVSLPGRLRDLLKRLRQWTPTS